MTTKLHIVDPLLLKLRKLVKSNERNLLSVAINRFGTETDVVSIKEALESAPQDVPLFLDLTPFASIGRHEEILSVVNKICPSAHLLITHNDMRDAIRSSLQTKRMSTVCFGPDGTLTELWRFGKCRVPPNIRRHFMKSYFEIEVPAKHCERLSELEVLRYKYSQQALVSLLHHESAIVRAADFPEHSQKLSGRNYLSMPNGMLVSSYLDLKKLAQHPDTLLTFAYECVMAMCRCFRRDQDWLGQLYGIAVPNNTALFLASAVSLITGKPLIAVDRLGPIPAIPHQRDELARLIKGRKLVLFEEVVATGNEVDRSILYLDACGAEITRVICGYNLCAGRPLLLSENSLRTLCHPAQEIRYEYRSARSI